MSVAKSVSTKSLKQRLDAGESIQLLDVRSRSEFGSGHLEGSINIPLTQLHSRVSEVHAFQPVVLVCHTGGRAGLAAGLLKKHCHDLAILQGGILGWKTAKLPLAAIARPYRSLERQIRFAAALLLLLGLALSVLISFKWLLLSVVAGLCLTFDGVANVCSIGLLLESLVKRSGGSSSAKRRHRQADAGAQTDALHGPAGMAGR